MLLPKRLDQTIINVLNFTDIYTASPLTQKNTISFLKKLIKLDPQCLTKFELSFKVNHTLNKDEGIRVLNLDSKAYSYTDNGAYLKRLGQYQSIVNDKIKNPFQEKLFSALASIADTPIDLYLGGDFHENSYLFAFWLILGGAKRNGKIKIMKNSDLLIKRLFTSLNITPTFKITKDILNIGFDINDSDFFYKIYYFLNKENYQSISTAQRKWLKKFIDFLGDKYKYWFFISERYRLGDEGIGRKKLYLEFLTDLGTKEKRTHKIIAELFKIVNCHFKISELTSILNSIDGNIIILAFEPDGTTTFYIRI